MVSGTKYEILEDMSLVVVLYIIYNQLIQKDKFEDTQEEIRMFGPKKTNVTPPLSIEVSVPSQKGESICVRIIYCSYHFDI
jgi:hypothetical protein